MSVVISYDDKFAMPSSEIKLASGEHVVMSLDKHGLTVKALAPGHTERVLYEGNVTTVAAICAGLVDDYDAAKMSPLQILAAVVVQLPDAAAVQKAFRAAAV